MHVTRSQWRRRVQLAIGVLAILALGGGACVILAVLSGRDYRPADSRELAVLEKHSAAVLAAAFSPDGELALTGDAEGQLCFWAPSDFRDLARVPAHEGAVTAVAISGDSKHAASGGRDGKVCVWDLARYERVESFQQNREPVHSVAFYPAGTHVAAGLANGQILLWERSAQKVVRRFRGHVGPVHSLAISLDGQYLLSGGRDCTVRLWRVETEVQIVRLEGHGQAVTGVALSAGGGRALSCSDDGTVSLWNVTSGDRLAVLQPPSAGVIRQASVSFSPGATRALAAGEDGVLRLWSCVSHQLVHEYRGHATAVTACCFFPTGVTGLSAARDGTVRLWRIPLLTAGERDRAEHASEQVQARVRALERFANRLARGAAVLQRLDGEHLSPDELRAFDERRLDEAILEFELAQREVDDNTLERTSATTLANRTRERKQQIADLKARLEKYAAHGEAGKKALEGKLFDQATAEFEAARALFPDRPEAAAGLEKVRQARELAAQLASLRLEASDIGWDFTPGKEGLLEQGREFAFLVLGTRTDPPVALTSSALTWTFRVHVESSATDSPLRLRVAVRQVDPERELAREEYPFAADQTRHEFRGQAAPPKGGWTKGDYVLEAFVVTPGSDTPVGQPRTIPIGVLRWQETKLDLTPALVLSHQYEVSTAVSPGAGDGYTLRADGELAPVPLPLHCFLVADPTVRKAPPVGPRGIPVSAESRKWLEFVQPHANFAALLYRRHDEPWRAYTGPTPVALCTKAGPFWLSINAITGARSQPGGDPLPIPKTKLRSEGGQYRVAILVGKFDFPMDLSDWERKYLLGKFR